MIFRISSKSEVFFGDHASDHAGEKVSELGCSRVICVYDKGVKDTGLLDPIIENIKKAGLDVVEYGDVLADPPDTMINECGEFARKEKVDGVVGIGGGSTMDTAKAANVLLGNPGSIQQYLGPGTPHEPSKPLLLIPTTSGTASEVTHVSVVTNTSTNSKEGVSGPATIADVSLIDPLLTHGLPRHITAATGMDTFAHALEAYTSKGTNMMSDMLSEKSLELAIKYLPRAVEDGSDAEARLHMSFSCMLAGMSFTDAIPHYGHAFGHSLGSLHHVPHGIGCAIAQPGVVEIVAELFPQKVRKLGELMGIGSSKDLSPAELGRAVGDEIVAFNKRLGIPTLKELKVKESDLEALAEKTVSDSCFFFVPKDIGKDTVLSIIEKAYAH